MEVAALESSVSLLDENFINGLLANTDQLFKNIYAFECTVHSLPGKTHRALTITHQDLAERRADFIEELRSTMCSWIYSKDEYKKILDEAVMDRGGDVQNACSFIHQLVKSKFRVGHPQGQFGELLLFNVMQHYFKSPALLRKMPITTNPSVERHGADAIHFRPVDGHNVIYIGEAKTYTSKYKFAAAIQDSVSSIITSYENISAELGYYLYDDFLDPGLRDIAKKFKNNALENARVELVCVASYDENSDKSGPSEADIKSAIYKIVTKKVSEFDSKCFDGHCPYVLERLHIFLVPVWDLKQLMELFEK